MKFTASLALLAAGLHAPLVQAAEANDGALRACRALTNATARLACYDALPLPLPAPAPTIVVPDSIVVAAPQAAFGLEARRAAETQQISSRINGMFEGWLANTRFTLANGQVWQVVDGTSAAYYLKDPKVTVARAALGSFRLEIEGAKQAPRVRRVE